MATASAPAAPAPATTRGRRHAALRLLPAAATIVGVAALLELVYAPYLNYDARYALVWARDLVHGVKPDYTAGFAPTPHPLETAVSILATPFGSGADTLLIWLVCCASVRSSGSRTGSVPSCSPRGQAPSPRSSSSRVRCSSATRCSAIRTPRSRC